MSILIPEKPYPLLGPSRKGSRPHAARIDSRRSLIGIERVVAYKLGLDMNITADQPLTMLGEVNGFLITKIRAVGASVSLTTAVGGIYSQPAKAGVIVVAAAQAYSGLTGNAVGIDLAITPAGMQQTGLGAGFSQLYFALTTAQGSAGTMNLYVMGVQTRDTDYASLDSAAFQKTQQP